MTPLDIFSDPAYYLNLVSGIAALFITAGTFALIYLTLKLFRSSEGLTTATDNLRKIQIRPKVVLAGKPHYDRAATKGALVMDVVNRGAGTAFETRMFASVGGIPEFPAELVGGDASLVPVTGGASFEIVGAVKGAHLELRLTYTDIEGTNFEEKFSELLYT